MNLGLYLHIPFCRRKCDYCSFDSIPVNNHNSKESFEEIDDYIKALIVELRERSIELNNFTVDTIYLGGGTPSLLSPSQLGIIFNEIHRYFNVIRNDLEISFECNPDDFSVKKIEEYKFAGVNRIVLGVQTLSKRLHALLGRSALLCDKNLLFDFAGIRDIVHCIDLIIGIHEQTENDLLRDLNEVVVYGFEHISAYLLSIESGTPISKRVISSQSMDDIQRTLLEKAMDFLKSAGYVHYEVSNYAKPSYESKHNLKYWQFLPYAGFGPGAHSFYNGERYYNTKSVEEYIKHKGNIRQNDIRTKKSEIVEYLLSGMRLAKGISRNDFESKLNLAMPKELMNKLNDMKKRGLVEIEEEETNRIIKFSKTGFFQMDNLIYEMTEMFL